MQSQGEAHIKAKLPAAAAKEFDEQPKNPLALCKVFSFCVLVAVC
jgi:hypothetical protein